MEAFNNPVEFGQSHREEISRLVDIADLSLGEFSKASPPVWHAQLRSNWAWCFVPSAKQRPHAQSLRD